MTTGLVTVIADMTDLTGISGISGNSTLNENDKIFYFMGLTSGPGKFLFGVNVISGNIISTATIPSSGVIDNDNLVFFRYDNLSSKLYAWFWEAHTVAPPQPPPVTPPPPVIPVAVDSSCRMDIETKVYFNNANHSMVVDKKTTTCKVTLSMYNMLGQLIMKNRIINDGYNEIQLPNFSTGIYLV